MIGAENPSNPKGLGGQRDPALVLVGGPLLWFGEDDQTHVVQPSRSWATRQGGPFHTQRAGTIT